MSMLEYICNVDNMKVGFDNMVCVVLLHHLCEAINIVFHFEI